MSRRLSVQHMAINAILYMWSDMLRWKQKSDSLKVYMYYRICIPTSQGSESEPKTKSDRVEDTERNRGSTFFMINPACTLLSLQPPHTSIFLMPGKYSTGRVPSISRGCGKRQVCPCMDHQTIYRAVERRVSRDLAFRRTCQVVNGRLYCSWMY